MQTVTSLHSQNTYLYPQAGVRTSPSGTSSVEINANGKRPLPEEIPSPPPETIFYTLQDVPAIKARFDACRYQALPIKAVSTFKIDPNLMTSGIKPYDHIRNDSYNKLTEIFFVKSPKPTQVDPTSDPLLIGLRETMLKDITERGGDRIVFAKAVKEHSNQCRVENPLDRSRKFFFSMIKDVFLLDAQNLYLGQARYAFAEMAFDQGGVNNPFLNMIASEVSLWLENNDIDIAFFYEKLYLKGSEFEERLSADLSDPLVLLRIYRIVFSEMQQTLSIDAEGEFISICQNVFLAYLNVSEGETRDQLEALLKQNSQKLMQGSYYLEGKYQPLVAEFLGHLDRILTHVENTAQLIQDNKEDTETFQLQILELLGMRDNFIALASIFSEDLSQFHRQRSKLSLIPLSKMVSDEGCPKGSKQEPTYTIKNENRGEDGKVLRFPFLSSADSFELQVDDPEAKTIIKVLSRFYDVYDSIHESNMLHLRKAIATVNTARMNLEMVIKKYDLLLHGPKEAITRKKLDIVIKA